MIRKASCPYVFESDLIEEGIMTMAAPMPIKAPTRVFESDLIEEGIIENM